MINVGQISYDKKIAIIMNPSAGKSNNLRRKKKVISDKLDANNIKHEFLITQCRSDTINFAKDLDID